MNRVLLVSLVVVAGGLCACKSDKVEEPQPAPPVSAVAKPGPAYAEVAAKYNANADFLRQLCAPVTVRMRYYDKDGVERNEQGEGRLQIVQPDHVAMSVGKVGETFFWLGSDSHRYWWFDLSGKRRLMYIGAHGNYELSQARRVGVVVAPLDLVRLLGIVALPEKGQTQMSEDGTLIGVTTDLEGGMRQRTWIDPKTYLPTKIELFTLKTVVGGANGKAEWVCELVSELSLPDGVDIKGRGERPRMNTRVIIAHEASRSQITLDLSSMQDGAGRMVPEAFDPAALAKQLRADVIYDLDAPPKNVPPKR
jgi:hypothetical protein